jgi:hypothetical protein
MEMGDNVVSMFSDEKQGQVNEDRVAGGNSDNTIDPRQRTFLKQRIGKRWSQIHEDVNAGVYTWAEFVEGLDAEELARGQLKDKDGYFRGRPPDFIPRQFLTACQREMIRRFNYKIQANFEAATDELIRLGTSDIMDPKDRVKVLQYLVERVVGKIPDKIEVAVADPWETIIGDILHEAPEGTKPPSYIENRTN